MTKATLPCPILPRSPQDQDSVPHPTPTLLLPPRVITRTGYTSLPKAGTATDRIIRGRCASYVFKHENVLVGDVFTEYPSQNRSWMPLRVKHLVLSTEWFHPSKKIISANHWQMLRKQSSTKLKVSPTSFALLANFEFEIKLHIQTEGVIAVLFVENLHFFVICITLLWLHNACAFLMLKVLEMKDKDH